MKFNHQYSLSKTQKQSLFIAVGVSILAQILPLANVVSQIYSTVFHELGHALTAWLFGYIALPRLDLINGGGVTHIISRPFLLMIVAAGFILLNLFLIKNKTSKKWFYVLLVSYFVAFFTPLHRLLITFMGKGGELLFFYFVGWYSLSRLILKIDFKALFYLILAVFLWINSVLDSLKLLYNEADRLWYEAGKQDLLGGTPLVNDLVKLTESTGLSFNFFNWLLLILAFYSLHKLLKISDKSLLDKRRIKEYGRLLGKVTHQQLSKIKKLGNDKTKK